jgi:lauroyl/myristoyl acyltransferase
MTDTRRPRADAPLAPEMFEGPARLRPALPLLRRVPPAGAGWLLASLAVLDGACRRNRLRLALEWAAAQGIRGAARWRLAFAILANHGRFVADEAMLGLTSATALRRTTVLRGAEHLEALSGGAVLLGFHLGPPRTSWVLQALGYPVTPAARFDGASTNRRMAAAVQSGALVRLPQAAPVARTQGLHRLLTTLRNGGLVYITADGPFGREAFRIQLPGRPLIVRAGWLSLRRQARVPVVPVLAVRDGGNRVIVVHSPLPAVDPDASRDTAACRAALGPILLDYVRRHPAQCRYLVFPRWLRETAAPPAS